MEGRPKIVILDDNEMFAELLAAALEEEYEVAVGHSGRHGLSLCLAGGVSAVITDIGMPDLDGVQMLGELSKYPALRNIPVLVVTATHFTSVSRESVGRYPQVKRMMSKETSVDVLAAELRSVLAAPGAPGAL